MKKLSLIVPIYNEASHLQEFFERIDGFPLPIEKQLIIIDDYSTDSSRDIIRNYPFKSETIQIFQDRNYGKGAAIRKGIENATGDIIGVQDADFEYEMNDIQNLIQPILDDKTDVVYGSRFKKNNPQVFRTFHYLINRFLTIFSNFCSGLYLTDMETCYKFFKADIIKNVNLKSNRFGFEPEITAKIARLKLRVYELPISYYPRNYLLGKKITWRDGIAAIRHIIYYNFFARTKNFFRDELPKKYMPQDSNRL